MYCRMLLRYCWSLLSLCSPLKYTNLLSRYGYSSYRFCEWEASIVVSFFEQKNIIETSFILFIVWINSSSSILNSPFFWRVFFIKWKPAWMKILGNSVLWVPNSIISSLRLLKGESSTKPWISTEENLCVSSYWYFKAATAPIDLPHSMNLFIPNLLKMCSATVSISYFSLAPNEILSPSEFPHPAKSKEQK